MPNERKQDRRAPVPPWGSSAAPVAGLLFDPAAQPGADNLVTLAQIAGTFDVVRRDDRPTAKGGRAELLRDGLMFDCRGLAPAPPLAVATVAQTIALPPAFASAAHALVTIAPGPQLAGAAQLLPVVRILAGLVLALAELPAVQAVVWLPAQIAMAPAWFVEAVGIWLQGGPFPALALTGLLRCDGGLASQGLAYFTGQEFVLSGRDGSLRENDMRGAVRLTDWLVAHGRIDAACDVDLTGFGTVRLMPEAPDRLRATVL